MIARKLINTNVVRRPEVRGCYVTVGSRQKEGSCNFCTDRKHVKVFVLRSKDPMRNSVITVCPNCMDNLIDGVLVDDQ